MENGFYSIRTAGINYRNIEIFYHYRTVEDILKPGSGLCLDLGARNSPHKQLIENLEYERIGIDIDYHGSLDAVADGCSLPFKDNTFSLVVLAQVLEHVFDPEAAVNEVYRVLKPGGTIVGGVSFLEPYHFSYFNLSHRAVQDILMSAGFKQICIEAGVTGIVLILARILGIFGSKNHRMFSAVSRFFFPVKYVLKCGYFLLGFKNRIQGRDLASFEKNAKDHYESIALSIAGHILFHAQK